MPKRRIEIKLHVGELLYDVENTTSLTGRARDDGKNYQLSADMRANEDDENRNQILRYLGNAFASLKSNMYEYLCASGTTANNIQLQRGEWDCLTVCLMMPMNFDLAAKDDIATSMHQYMVNMALGEWFGIFSKDDMAIHLKQAAGNLAAIREALSKRVRFTRSCREN